MSYDELMNAYLNKISENEKLKIQVENQNLEINNLKRIIYGVKREYTPKKEQVENTQQCSLFADDQDIDKEVKEQIKENVEEITVYKKKNTKTKKAGIKKNILKNVEVEIKEYEISPEEKCPVCNGE